MVIWLALYTSTARAGVVINEFLPDPAGADGGFEWVELYNDGGTTVDLTGWKLQKATSTTISTVHTFTGSIAPNGYVLIGEASVPGTTATAVLALGNAGTSGDLVRLTDPNDVPIDTVIYGPDNSDGFLDDTNAVATSFAPISGGTSTARVPNGTDSNASATDFILLATPSPGANNNSTLPTCDGATTGVVINEVVPDPAGTDTDQEWVELYNPSGATVDLSGWAIAAGTSSYSTQGTLPNGTTLGAQQFLMVGQSALSSPDVVAAGFTLGNASNADAVQLRDCVGNVADTVVYGTDNSDGWLDDNGVVAALAPKPVDGESIGRHPDGVDTQDSAVDFTVSAVPTPRAPNTGGVGPVECDPASGSGIVINEFVPDPPGSDADNEWVEIYNAGSSVVDISGWGLATGTSSFSGVGALPPGLSLAPGAFFVIGQSVLTSPDAITTFSLGNATSSADGVQLRDCNGAVADTVIYGIDNPDEWVDDTGNLAMLAPRPGSGQAVGRIPDGQDSNNSAADFSVIPPTRGYSNTSPPPDCGGFGARLVINEFLTNPAGADDDLEWIELYNAGPDTIDLAGWAVESAGSTSWSPRITFDGGQTIASGQFLLIGGALVPGITHPMAGTLGNGTGGDGLRIVDCGGTIVDVVVYGGNNDDLIPDETGNPANSVAPTPPEDGSVQRVLDGYDTGTNNADFAVSEQPTPGQPNLEITPIVCEPSAGGVRINELVPDPDGTDDGLEWFELYNAGSSAQSIAGWAFSAGTSNFDSRNILVPGGIEIAPGAFLVIGGELVPEANVVIDFSLGNGSSNRDGLRMFDCEGSVVDTVIYGALEEDEPDEGIVDDLGQLAGSYGDPNSTQSLFRKLDGVDTDSAEDWQVGRKTPGATNVLEVGPPTDDGKGCGCGGPPNGNAPGGGPSGEAPSSTGCSTIPAQTLAFSFGLLVALRRRR